MSSGPRTHHSYNGEQFLHDSEKCDSKAAPRRLSRREILGALGASLSFPLIEEAASCLSLPASAVAVLQPVPTAVQTVTTGTILGPVGTLPDYFMGLAYEKGDFVTELLFTSANTSLAGLFNALGNGVLAIGGNSLDTVVWTPDGPGNTAGQVAPADVDNLAGFLALTNWKVIYGVNLATSTPALAAAEVAYVQATLGNAILGYQIGNEPDEYYLSYFPNGWNLSAFQNLWGEFRSAIVAATPGANITGPATGGNVTTWTVPFILSPSGKLISLLTQHYYRGNGHNVNATVANLVSPDPTIIADCVALDWSVSALHLPFRFTETNSYLYGGSPGVSNAYASALWVIDHLFHIALGGACGVNMQGGDSACYTPIANLGSTVLEAMPEYYGLLFFSLAGQGTLLQTKLAVTNFNATMYAVLNSSGVTNIVIVNKEVYSSLRITINCGRTVNSASLIELLNTNLSATTGQTIQGATVSIDGSFTPGAPYAPANVSSFWVTCYIPAISAVLLQIR
jgi:hypothetical protein